MTTTPAANDLSELPQSWQAILYGCGAVGPCPPHSVTRPVCNRTKDHPLPHRVYNINTFAILAEWTDNERTP